MKDMSPDSPQDAEADLAVAVKVGVEADSVVSGGDELDSRWVDGVVGGTAEQEEEEAPFVRCVERPCDQGMDLSANDRNKCVSGGTDVGLLDDRKEGCHGGVREIGREGCWG